MLQGYAEFKTGLEHPQILHEVRGNYQTQFQRLGTVRILNSRCVAFSLFGVASLITRATR